MNRNMLTILILGFFNLFCSCESEDVNPTPPNPQPTGETVFTIGTIPDSIKVETSTDTKFSVNQKGHPEKFKISVDTVMAFFYKKIAFDAITGDNVYLEADRVNGTAEIRINGKSFSDIDSLIPGVENTLSFSNPTAVGEYKIILNVTDKFKRTKKQEIKIKVFSPKVVIKFYQIEIGFDEENYFTMLNEKYTYNPLSPELKGFRIDTIYTREEPVHGRPGEWTIPGQRIACYIGQEGGNDFFYAVGSNRSQTTTDFATRWDGNINTHLRQKPGFHGIMFQTATTTTVGAYHLTIYLIDKWGKEAMATIVYKAFGRNESIPAHATPVKEESNNYRWGHRIAD